MIKNVENILTLKIFYDNLCNMKSKERERKTWEEQKKSGQIEERIDIISKFLENGGTKEEAKRMLEVSEEDIIMAEKRISEIHQTICV